jgi:hypothetical protein
MSSIQPSISTDLFMERIRRAADTMTKDELLIVVHQLSHAYSVQRAAAVWAVNQAAENLSYGCTARDCPAKRNSPGALG